MKNILMGASILFLVGNVYADTTSKTTNLDERRAAMKTERMEDQRDANETIRDSSRAYHEIVKTSQGEVPRSILLRAQCIAVFPNTITAAAVVGGVHGNGVATCKNDGKWSTPAIVNLNGGSLGAQIGGKESDIVLFMNNPRAISALRNGKFEIAADASVTAGRYDAAADISNAPVVAYERSEGAYVGASLTGGTISPDEDANHSLYGKDSNFLSIVDGKINSLKQAETFLSGLPS